MNSDEKKREIPSARTMLETLDRAGFRQTWPRQIIAEYLAYRGKYSLSFTIEELWRDICKTHPGIGRTTTFRTIDLFVKLGLVDRVVFADGTERYHVGTGTHQYLTCEVCHKIVELSPSLAPDLLVCLAQQFGFSTSGHRVEIFGRCPDCSSYQIKSRER